MQTTVLWSVVSILRLFGHRRLALKVHRVRTVPVVACFAYHIVIFVVTTAAFWSWHLVNRLVCMSYVFDAQCFSHLKVLKPTSACKFILLLLAMLFVKDLLLVYRSTNPCVIVTWYNCGLFWAAWRLLGGGVIMSYCWQRRYSVWLFSYLFVLLLSVIEVSFDVLYCWY